jgi:Ni,Fe-hydrogenase III large subunit
MAEKEGSPPEEQLDLLPEGGIDWSRAEVTPRVWLEDIGGDHGARLEFLADQGLRLLMVDLGPGEGETMHFYNPRDEETLHLRAGGGLSLLSEATKYFPQAARWIELMRGAEREDDETRAATMYLEREDLLLEVTGGRVEGVSEAWRKCFQPALCGLRAAPAGVLLEEEGGAEGTARSIAFAGAIEDARGMKAPVAALALRAVLLESSRIRGHLAWMSALASALGRPRATARLGSFLDDLEEGLKEWLGEPNEKGWVIPGGVKEDFPIDKAAGMEERLAIAVSAWEEVSPRALSLPVPRRAEKRLGRLCGKAKDSAWSGPMARTLGQVNDVRKEEPGVYPLAGWEDIAIPESSGYLCRMLALKAGEVGSSLRVMRRILGDLPEPPLLIKRGRGGRGEGFGRCEGPEGEICCHVATEKGRISYAAFSLPWELNRSAARCLAGIWLDEAEILSFLWRTGPRSAR